MNLVSQVGAVSGVLGVPVRIAPGLHTAPRMTTPDSYIVGSRALRLTTNRAGKESISRLIPRMRSMLDHLVVRRTLSLSILDEPKTMVNPQKRPRPNVDTMPTDSYK